MKTNQWFTKQIACEFLRYMERNGYVTVNDQRIRGHYDQFIQERRDENSAQYKD